VDRIIRQLKKNFHVNPQSEITLEMDPGTFTCDRLLSLRDCGINRISMGVQSFDNAMLRHCGRPHTVEDTERALNDLHRVGWENFSIDLISSLPHLTPQLWAETLHRAAQCGSAHISVYDLQVEPGTAFARWYTPGASPLPAEGDAADMYRTAASALTAAGFEHYEVSNYAKPGRRSRHNLKYWTCAPVLSFGMAAASYLRGERFVRPKKMQEYEKYVLDLLAADAAAGEHSAEQGLNRQGEQQQQRHHAHIPDMLDVVMLALRTADGLDLASFTELYGSAATARVLGTLEPYRQRGLVLGGTAAADINRDGICSGCSGDGSEGSGGSGESRVRLSDPEGFLLSNDIISSVFAALPDSSSQQ
jgi:oxygen-independent coproporphyrinogen-3 oxidase